MNISKEVKDKISEYILEQLRTEWFYGAQNSAPPANKKQADSVTEEIIQLFLGNQDKTNLEK
jgi:hypothetical protein